MRILILFREAFRDEATNIADQLSEAGLMPVVQIVKSSTETIVDAARREIEYADRVLLLWENGIKAEGSLARLACIAGIQAKAVFAWIEPPERQLPIESISLDISSAVRANTIHIINSALLEALRSSPPKIDDAYMSTLNDPMLDLNDTNILYQGGPPKPKIKPPPSPVHSKSAPPSYRPSMIWHPLPVVSPRQQLAVLQHQSPFLRILQHPTNRIPLGLLKKASIRRLLHLML